MYHYNPRTGEVTKCMAKSPETCPYGVENHAQTLEEIQKVADKKNQEKVLLVKSCMKKLESNIDEVKNDKALLEEFFKKYESGTILKEENYKVNEKDKDAKTIKLKTLLKGNSSNPFVELKTVDEKGREATLARKYLNEELMNIDTPQKVKDTEIYSLADKYLDDFSLKDSIVKLNSEKEFPNTDYATFTELKSFRKMSGLTKKDKQNIVSNLEKLKKEVKNGLFNLKIDDVIEKVQEKDTNGFRIVNLDTCCDMQDGRPAYNLYNIAYEASSKGKKRYFPENIISTNSELPNTACITPTEDKEIYEYRDNPESNEVKKIKIDPAISKALLDTEFIKEIKGMTFNEMRSDIILKQKRAKYHGVDILMPRSDGTVPDYTTENEDYIRQSYIFDIIKKKK